LRFAVRQQVNAVRLSQDSASFSGCANAAEFDRTTAAG